MLRLGRKGAKQEQPANGDACISRSVAFGVTKILGADEMHRHVNYSAVCPEWEEEEITVAVAIAKGDDFPTEAQSLTY